MVSDESTPLKILQMILQVKGNF